MFRRFARPCGKSSAEQASQYHRDQIRLCGVPNGIRTRVLALKGPRPGPLDDGDQRWNLQIVTHLITGKIGRPSAHAGPRDRQKHQHRRDRADEQSHPTSHRRLRHILASTRPACTTITATSISDSNKRPRSARRDPSSPRRNSHSLAMFGLTTRSTLTRPSSICTSSDIISARPQPSARLVPDAGAVPQRRQRGRHASDQCNPAQPMNEG